MSAAQTDVRIADWLNRVHQGDCLQVLAQLPDESVDLVVTSPPYNLAEQHWQRIPCLARL